MNQILSVENQNYSKQSYKSSNKMDKKIVIAFFSCIAILFALIIIVIGINNVSKYKGNEGQENIVITGNKPKIDIEILSETTLNIIVSHDKQISSVEYQWNDGEKVQKTDVGENQIEIPVEIPSGTNTLTVSVKDINGEINSKISEYTGEQNLGIVLKAEGSQVKLTAKSNNTISYISYNWDGGEEKQIQINDVQTEQYIDILEGEHTLNVVMVDVEGQETATSQKMIGDTKPEIKDIKTDRINLYIQAIDDEGLSKLTIELYDTGEKQEIVLNDVKTYETKMVIDNLDMNLQAGKNRMIITVYNVNGLKDVKYIILNK